MELSQTAARPSQTPSPELPPAPQTALAAAPGPEPGVICRSEKVSGLSAAYAGRGLESPGVQISQALIVPSSPSIPPRLSFHLVTALPSP